MYGFIYPSKRSKIPRWVMDEMAKRVDAEMRRGDDDADKTCYGTIISRQQYLIDIDLWGYKDARLQPNGKMNAEQIAHWTAGIDQDGSK